MDSKLEEKELEDIGDFISAAITAAAPKTTSIAKDDATATLDLKGGTLLLTLTTPRGDATFNLKYVLQSIGNGRGVFAKTPSVAERVTLDYFRRIA